MHAIVTAGGTEVPLDDVRMLTNRSKGTFLWEIACALADHVDTVTVVGSERLRERIGNALPPGITFVPFRTYDDLVRELAAAIELQRPDILLMGAAVSDYGPAAAVAGKIPSANRTLTIKLQRLAKILPGLRAQCGRRTFLVGFKLTAGASDAELIAAAARQLHECRTNLTIANDARRLGGGRHPVTLVTPEGGAIPIAGERREAAHAVADFIVRRAHTTWYTSQRHGPGGRSRTRSRGYERASEALAFAQASGLLRGSPGNVSAREGDRLWVTPRAVVHKERLPSHRLIAAEVPPGERRVFYHGRQGDKPSIDTPVHAAIYRACPWIDFLFHTHGAWLIPDATTVHPYPCGTVEEAYQIIDALRAVGDPDAHQRFGIELVHHGELIGVESNGHARLSAEWAAATAAYGAHLHDIGEGVAAATLDLRPIFRGGTIVGVAATDPTEHWTSFFLIPKTRGTGLGQQLVELIDARRTLVGVHDRCGVLDFYLDRGFRIRETRGALSILEPPSLREDVQTAVTVCLYCPETKRVLLARRNPDAPTWPGYWVNPGGRVVDGETLLAAAEREVREEIGLDICGVPTAKTSRTVTVGWNRGEFAISATCLLKEIPSTTTLAGDPAEIAEVRWYTMDEARALPLAWGTRQALREFFP